jgi:hypothetical protein
MLSGTRLLYEGIIHMIYIYIELYMDLYRILTRYIFWVTESGLIPPSDR